MSVTTAVRSLLRRTVCRRYSSTQAGPSIAPSAPKTPTYPAAAALPPAKMRALITLYHHAEQFITTETLDEAIDRAFIDKPDELNSVLGVEDKMGTLRTRMRAQRDSPRMVEANHIPRALTEETQGSWSERRRLRQVTVADALYGTENFKPGLEVLKEEAPMIRKALHSDREKGY